MASSPRTIGVVLFEGFELLDVFGPCEAYGIRDLEGAFRIAMVAEKARPIRTGKPSPRCASTAASTAARAEPNAAQTPSPVCLNNQPPCASTAVRNTSS